MDQILVCLDVFRSVSSLIWLSLSASDKQKMVIKLEIVAVVVSKSVFVINICFDHFILH